MIERNFIEMVNALGSTNLDNPGMSDPPYPTTSLIEGWTCMVPTSCQMSG